jgi:hypothetical protein
MGNARGVGLGVMSMVPMVTPPEQLDVKVGVAVRVRVGVKVGVFVGPEEMVMVAPVLGAPVKMTAPPGLDAAKDVFEATLAI